MKFDKTALLLYAITDRSWLGSSALYDQVELALRGGTTILQLREKNLGDAAFLEEAKSIRKLCRQYKVPFIINDKVDVALAAGADGIHVGQHDMEACNVRRLLGEDKILGVSAQTVEQAVLAQKQGADYLGVGAVFPTGSKDDAEDVSIETLRDICRTVSIPVVAIGGITAQNVAKLKGSGICGAAVISAVFAQPDILEAAGKLKAAIRKAVE